MLIITLITIIILLIIYIILNYIKLNKYKLLFNNINFLFIIFDVYKNNKIKYITNSVKSFCGYTQNDFYKNSSLFQNIIHPDDYTLFENMKQNKLPIKAPIVIRWLKKDKSVIWVEQDNINVYNKNKKLVAIIMTVHDISFQKQNELSPQEIKKLYKESFNNATDCIFMHMYTEDGLSGKFIDINETALKWLEYNREDFLKLKFKAIIDKSNTVSLENKFQTIFHNGKSNYETELISRTGNIIPVEINSSNFIYKDEQAVLSIARDISIRKEMENEILKNQKLESIGILAGGIAHDFNNSLSVFLSNVDLAEAYLDDKEELQGILNDIRTEIIKTTGLTNQLLTFSTGGMPVKETASISDLLKETIKFDLRGTNIHFKYDFVDNLWLVGIDYNQISQVINNIIINARQAMSDKGEIIIKAENLNNNISDAILPADKKYIKITISDNGIGIPKDIQSKIFNPFFTTKDQGSGLGLTTSFSIVKKHDGFLTMKSHENLGTSIFIYLPALSISDQNKKLKNQKQVIKSSGKILVMEDQKVIRKSIVRMLNYIGYEVEEAEEGKYAIELYKKAQMKNDPFDIILMDLTIQKGLGGNDTSKILFEYEPEIKIVISSDYSNDPVIANYREYGYKNVIIKPYTIYQLSSVIHSVLSESS